MTGCGTRRVAPSPPQPLPVQSRVDLGECANPATEGVLGDAPVLQRANRDLDGDDIVEEVVADSKLCTNEGNCHWNVFRVEGGCHRFLGTISAAGIQRVRPRSEDGFYGLRSVWRLTGGNRILVQEYRFRRGGYRLVDAVLCRQLDDDRIICEDTK